jgi:hypothetical protein
LQRERIVAFGAKLEFLGAIQKELFKLHARLIQRVELISRL